MRSFQKILIYLNVILLIAYGVLVLDSIRIYGINTDVYSKILEGFVIFCILSTIYGIYHNFKHTWYVYLAITFLLFFGGFISLVSLNEYVYCLSNFCGDGYGPMSNSGYIAGIFIGVIPMLNLWYFAKIGIVREVVGVN